MEKNCSQSSKHANNSEYICNPSTGRWVLRRGKLGQSIINSQLTTQQSKKNQIPASLDIKSALKLPIPKKTVVTRQSSITKKPFDQISEPKLKNKLRLNGQLRLSFLNTIGNPKLCKYWNPTAMRTDSSRSYNFSNRSFDGYDKVFLNQMKMSGAEGFDHLLGYVGQSVIYDDKRDIIIACQKNSIIKFYSGKDMNTTNKWPEIHLDRFVFVHYISYSKDADLYLLVTRTHEPTYKMSTYKSDFADKYQHSYVYIYNPTLHSIQRIAFHFVGSRGHILKAILIDSNHCAILFENMVFIGRIDTGELVKLFSFNVSKPYKELYYDSKQKLLYLGLVNHSRDTTKLLIYSLLKLSQPKLMHTIDIKGQINRIIPINHNNKKFIVTAVHNGTITLWYQKSGQLTPLKIFKVDYYPKDLVYFENFSTLVILVKNGKLICINIYSGQQQDFTFSQNLQSCASIFIMDGHKFGLPYEHCDAIDFVGLDMQ